MHCAGIVRDVVHSNSHCENGSFEVLSLQLQFVHISGGTTFIDPHHSFRELLGTDSVAELRLPELTRK